MSYATHAPPSAVCMQHGLKKVLRVTKPLNVLDEVKGEYLHRTPTLRRLYPEGVGFYPLPKCPRRRANPPGGGGVNKEGANRRSPQRAQKNPEILAAS